MMFGPIASKPSKQTKKTPKQQRGRAKQRKYRSALQKELRDACDEASDNSAENAVAAEKFNPFKNVQWKFLDGTITRQPSRQDLMRYPSEVLTDPQFINEDEHNFEMWKQDYLESLDVAGFMYHQSNAKAAHTLAAPAEPNLSDLGSPGMSSVPSAQILFINDEDEEHKGVGAELAPSFSSKQLPQTEEDILRQTEEYLMSLNRISQHIAKVDHLRNIDRSKSADEGRSGHMAPQPIPASMAEFVHKRNVFSTIPSTQQLLQNIADFEQRCENDVAFNAKAKGDDAAQNKADADDDWNDSRSPSPVIIWRPSSRVTIAKDLPANLQSVYMPEEDEQATSGGPSQAQVVVQAADRIATQFQEFDFEDFEEQNVAMLELQGVKSGAAAQDGRGPTGGDAEMPEWNSNKRKTARAPIKYGAWYIPPRKWVARKKGEATEYKDSDAINPELERKAKHLGNIIPELFISKMYKQYVQTHKEQSKRFIPNYLERVDVNEKPTEQ